jgi:hypothetical protein
LVGDNDTPSIEVLQDDMAAFLPGKRETGFFEHFFSVLTGSHFDHVNDFRLTSG